MLKSLTHKMASSRSSKIHSCPQAWILLGLFDLNTSYDGINYDDINYIEINYDRINYVNIIFN